MESTRTILRATNVLMMNQGGSLEDIVQYIVLMIMLVVIVGYII